MNRMLLIAAVLFVTAFAARYNLPADDRAAVAPRIASFERSNANKVITAVSPRRITAIANNGSVSAKFLHRKIHADFKGVILPIGSMKVIG